MASSGASGQSKSEGTLIFVVLIIVAICVGLPGRVADAMGSYARQAKTAVVTHVEPVARDAGAAAWSVYSYAHAGDEGPAPHWLGGPG